MNKNYLEKFNKMKVAGKLAAQTLDMIQIMFSQAYQQIKLINFVMNL